MLTHRAPVLLLLVLIGTQVLGQNKVHTWFFADSLGLQFDEALPDERFDGVCYRATGTSVLCDAEGRLLFYTDGRTVWDRDHKVMPNGTDLLGTPNVSQCVIAVQQPGTPFCYIFASGLGASSPEARYGYNYSVVDLRRNGGKGEVIRKNVFLARHSIGAISAKRVNDTAFCIAMHQWYERELLPYRLSPCGLHLMSRYPMDVCSVTRSSSQMKFAPNGKYLAYWYYNYYCKERLYVLDLDLANYRVESKRFVDSMSWRTIEFSANSRYLYGIGRPFCPKRHTPDAYQPNLFQFAVDSIDRWRPSNALEPIHTFEHTSGQLMAITPFGQIFISAYNFTSSLDAIQIHAILTPASPGSACRFRRSYIRMKPQYKPWCGIPNNCIDYTLMGKITASDACVGDTVTLELSSLYSDSLTWLFGDGTRTTRRNVRVNHVYRDRGSLRGPPLGVPGHPAYRAVCGSDQSP